jgi:hypothetical protein
MFPEIDTGRTKLQMLAWQAKYMAEWHKREANPYRCKSHEHQPLGERVQTIVVANNRFQSHLSRLLNLGWYDRKQEYLGAKDRQGL